MEGILEVSIQLRNYEFQKVQPRLHRKGQHYGPKNPIIFLSISGCSVLDTRFWIFDSQEESEISPNVRFNHQDSIFQKCDF